MGSNYCIIPEDDSNFKAKGTPAVVESLMALVVDTRPSSTFQLAEFLRTHPRLTPPDVKSSLSHPFFKSFPRTALHLLAYDGGEIAIDKVRLLVTKHQANVQSKLQVDDNEDEDKDVDDNEDEDEDVDDSLPRPSPLYVAVSQKNASMVRSLISLGHPVDDPKLDYAVPTPLHLAIKQGSLEMVEVLLAMGANPNATESINNHSCLKQTDSVEISTLLVAMGANVNARSSVGWTCLHFTPVRGSLALAQFLFANGGNPRMRDGDAKTTPAFVAFCGEEAKSFYMRAEKYWKVVGPVVRNLLDGEVDADEDVALLLPLGEREALDDDVSAARELLHELLPHMLTPEKRAETKARIYRAGEMYRQEASSRRIIYAAIFALKEAEPKLPENIVRFIIEEFLKAKNPHFDFDPRDTDWEQDDEDFKDWPIPDDANEENNFEGGIGPQHPPTLGVKRKSVY